MGLAAVASLAMTADAVADQSCSPWSCGSNTPVLWGVPIVGLSLDGQANADGVTLDRRLFRPERDGLRDTGCVLEVSKGRLLAKTPAGRACSLGGLPADPIGLVFSLKVPWQKGCGQAGEPVEVKVRIAGSGSVDSWDLDANKAPIPTYHLVWHDLSGAREVLAARGDTHPPREGESVCPMRDASWMEAWQTHSSVWQVGALPPRKIPVEIPKSSPWFAMTDHLLLMQGETYNKDSAAIDPARRGARWFNLGCAGTAIAKLRLLGYEPLRPETGSAAERQATLKMITGRYRGESSYTAGGVPLVWKHRRNKRIAGQPAPDLPTSDALIESHWDAAGAQCLSHRRTWFEPRSATPGEVWAAQRRAMPEASPHTRLAVLSPSGSWDYLGAEERSLAELRAAGVRPCTSRDTGTAFWTTYVVDHAHR